MSSTTHTNRRRIGLGARVAGVVVIGAFILAACVPEPAPDPPAPAAPPPLTTAPTTTTTVPPPPTICDSLGAPVADATPTDAAPVEFIAVTEGRDGRPSVHTFRASSKEEKQAKVKRLHDEEGEVASVEPDAPVYAVTIDDPVYVGTGGATPMGPQWWIDRAGFEAGWGAGNAQGAGVRVAIIDSGVQADHEDLGRTETGGNVAPGADFLSSAVLSDERTDSGTHGTHVAGIVGAMDNTVGGIGGAPDVTIIPVRVLDNDNGSVSAVVSGILWAADPAQGDVDVINLSLGSGKCSPAMYDAVEYAVNQGVTVVAAGGNCGCSTQELFPAAFSSVLDGVIAVASTTDTDAKSSFSNVNDYVTIAAPGSVIWSTVPANTYAIKSGTSMASPVVAAAAALLKAKCPTYTPTQIRNRLTSTALDLGNPGVDTSFGAGLLRADAALAPAC